MIIKQIITRKYLLLFYFSVFLLVTACSKNDEDVLSEQDEYKLEIISYFKDVALGFENGRSSNVTRKWDSPMKVFIDGDPSQRVYDQIERTLNNINELATDGFSAEIINDINSSNCYFFFGTRSDFIEKFPDALGQIGSNYAIFNVWWNDNVINRARIFIDINRPTLTQQESLVLEEITQSLGFGRDSPKYPSSIFYETLTDGGFATAYSNIDKELVRLLYHPEMIVGLDRLQVDTLLRDIQINE